MAAESGSFVRMDAAARAQVLREDQAWVGKSFDVKGNARAIQANTRHLALILLDTNVEDRASRAAAFTEDLVSSLLADHTTGPIACAKGCSHCCNTFVSATLPEIFNLARAVRQTPARQHRVLAAAEVCKGIPQHLREVNRVPCPMLEDHACSEYLSRPISCRYLLSTSLETCVKILKENQSVPFAYVDNTIAIRTFALIMLKTSMKLAGLPNQHYELNQALAIILSTPDAELRWLGGEPMFPAQLVDKVDQSASPFNGMVDHLAGIIRPTL
jgi:Fe-S-cluster containining protein